MEGVGAVGMFEKDVSKPVVPCQDQTSSIAHIARPAPLSPSESTSIPCNGNLVKPSVPFVRLRG